MRSQERAPSVVRYVLENPAAIMVCPLTAKVSTTSVVESKPMFGTLSHVAPPSVEMSMPKPPTKRSCPTNFNERAPSDAGYVVRRHMEEPEETVQSPAFS